jgi:hypothetical protein
LEQDKPEERRALMRSVRGWVLKVMGAIVEENGENKA